ncbi:hypothetical protein [Arthrobacter sp. 35W]|uniref:hypothetical protein n=1 Tax=Arthrobacter sp. 35W TaxID=1132441 RepID=UPI0005501C6C|nr:hypothetical protein [Arthrobacter sp. 35W]
MFEIPQRPSRNHSFSKEQKWSLLLEYDKCLDRGAKAAFCRTVGLTAGTMRDWAIAREQGRLMPPGTAGKSTKPEMSGWMNNRDRDELNRLRRENETLRAKLEKSEAAVDILGKASALLDALARSATATDPHLEGPVPGRPDWLAKTTPHQVEDHSAE